MTTMRMIFLDTETTGLSPDDGDRIIEIGCIEMESRRLTGRTLHRYLNPQRSSHPDALKVHGLTDEFLADKPLFEHVVDELLAFVGGAEIVIHNAAFDVAFLNQELRRIDREGFHGFVHRVSDSLSMAREMYPGKANSLDALCKRLEVDNSNRALHGALLDAGLLAEVYLRMTRGQNSLVIDDHGLHDDAGAMELIDLSQFDLKVIVADEAETAAHETLLIGLDKASAGRSVWRRREPAPPPMA